jgi:hypothetical protein
MSAPRSTRGARDGARLARCASADLCGRQRDEFRFFTERGAIGCQRRPSSAITCNLLCRYHSWSVASRAEAAGVDIFTGFAASGRVV